jgi:shikimate kinase
MPLIFLVGFMGSGKTTLGKKLANRLDVPFLDTDQEIERQENSSIENLFHEKGEAYFRSCEKKIIDTFPFSKDMVISLGGGLPCFSNLMETLNNKGITIYLKRSPKELLVRLEQAKTKRPLLRDKNKDELEKYIEYSLETREVYYEKSKIILDRDQQNVSSILDVIHSLV